MPGRWIIYQVRGAALSPGPSAKNSPKPSQNPAAASLGSESQPECSPLQSRFAPLPIAPTPPMWNTRQSCLARRGGAASVDVPVTVAAVCCCVPKRPSDILTGNTVHCPHRQVDPMGLYQRFQVRWRPPLVVVGKTSRLYRNSITAGPHSGIFVVRTQ